MPPNTVYVGRPTQWENPFRISETMTREESIWRFEDSADELDLAPLRGKNLACWCPLDVRCHADVLLERANPDSHDLREALASLSHDIWAHWMKYQFSQCEEDDLGMVINWPDVDRWQRQMKTPYNELFEREKDSDREQADKIITVLRDMEVLT